MDAATQRLDLALDAQAAFHGASCSVSGRTVLSLFDYTGNWSRPYAEAGANVVQSEPQTANAPGVGFSDLVVPLCDHCLQRHGEDDGCKCAKCGCGLHPHFIRTAIVENKPNVLCPNCDADKRHNE